MSIQQQKHFLEMLAPFSSLTETLLEKVAASLDVVYFPLKAEFTLDSNTSSLETESKVTPAVESAALYFVIKGRVAEYDAEDRIRAIYTHHTYFGESILMKQDNWLRYEVVEEAIVYRLANEHFQSLLKDAAFRHYFTDSITQKLNAFHERIQGQAASESLMGLVYEASLQSLAEVSSKHSLRHTVQVMQENNVDASVVSFHKVSPNGNDAFVMQNDSPLKHYGLVTSMDILTALAADDRLTLDSPVGSLAQRELVTIDAMDYLFNALLKMTKFHLNRLVVRRHDQPIGILHQKDLMGEFASHSGMAVFQIQQAESVAALHTIVSDTEALVESLHRKGVKTHYIAKLVNEIHRKILQRLLSLLDPQAQFSSLTLLVLGSEGRAEQVIRTDQDNAFILNCPREQLPGLADFTKRFEAAVVSLGFPPCPGQIMVSNPLWTQTESQFKSQVKQWMLKADESSFMHVSILFDAEVVDGSTKALDAIKHQMIEWTLNHPEYLRFMAKPVLQFDTPVSFFGRLVTETGEHRSEIDLKKGGIFPIVHGIRCLALEKGLLKTNTHWRIKSLMDMGVFSESFGIELGETLNYLNTLRLESMLLQMKEGKTPNNFLQVAHLTPTQQSLLKEAFTVVNRFKKWVDNHFKLGVL